ncbi:hypothetical protein [Streptomyces sp. NPDC056401]|uniref:hypothetical protein n=1 Tax=Streptomyces sp. NPDC056401 TaxID=3345809 RepID=UPI0035DC622D
MTMGERVDDAASRRASLRHVISRARERDLIADWVSKDFDAPDFLLDGIAVEVKSTRLGSAWNSQARLGMSERDLRDALTAWESFRSSWDDLDLLRLRPFHATAPAPEPDGVAAILAEAFGPIALSPRVAQLRREFRTAGLVEKPEPAEVFGAYALSAGLLPPTVDVDPVAGGTFGEVIGHGYLVAAKAETAHARVERIVSALTALANLVAVWRADLLRVIQQRLLPVAYEYADHVPPLASSPCGVIRMASPRVPRGSLRALQLDTPGPSRVCPSWALAA